MKPGRSSREHHRRSRDPLHPEWRGPHSFTVAVSHRSKHNGEWQDVNDGFFRCTAWRSVAENAAQILKKGMQLHYTHVGGERLKEVARMVDRDLRENLGVASFAGDGPPSAPVGGRKVRCIDVGDRLAGLSWRHVI